MSQNTESACLEKDLRCLACGSGRFEAWARAWDAEYHTTDERFTLYRCLDCRVLFIDPVPQDRLEEIYPPNYYSFVIPKGSLVNILKRWLDGRLFGGVLKDVPGQRLSVLDVGGGAGWHLNAVKRIDPRVGLTQVVDLDLAAAVIAEKNGHHFFEGRIQDFRSDICFDFVLLLNLIEHVENPCEVLIKIRTMLSPKGVVLVKTPNYDSLDARLFRHTNWGGYHCPRHWVLFERGGFTEMAARAGLQVETFHYTQGAPFWATSVLFWLAERGAVSITRERPAVYHPLFPLLNAIFAAFDFLRGFLGAKTSQMFFVLRGVHP